MPDVLVTGLPRSGLTVVSALIDYLPNAVCLNAPDWQAEQARRMSGRPALFCKWLAGDFVSIRKKLRDQEPVPDHRAADGAPFLDGMRGAAKPVFFARPNLKDDFILGMKHHALYTSLLPKLCEFDHFKIIAVIRHPLDVLASWQRLEKHAIAEGRLPMAARFWPEAARISESKDNKLTRMVQLYETHLERYHALRDKIHIVKYEEAIENPMLVSQLLGSDTISAAARLIEHRPRIRITNDAAELREIFKKYGVFTREYYSRI